MWQRILVASLFLVLPIALSAQHGTARADYYPLGYAGDTWTGVVSAVDDATQEITLAYVGKKKTESFVGVLGVGYKARQKDGTMVPMKVSMIPLGTRLRVYYMAQEQKVDGRKVKVNGIFRVDTLTAESK